MTGDLQLFMLWNNGRRLEKQILADIGSRYEIAGICEVFWPPRHFARNLARFYGKNLRKGAKKIRECGTGPFLVIVILGHSMPKLRMMPKPSPHRHPRAQQNSPGDLLLEIVGSSPTMTGGLIEIGT